MMNKTILASLTALASVDSKSALAYTLGVEPSGTACPKGLVIIVR